MSDAERQISELETRVENLEKTLLLQHNTLMRLFNHEMALNALAVATSRQRGLDHCQLVEDFEALMLASIEQVQPGHQVPEAFEQILSSLRKLCSRDA